MSVLSAPPAGGTSVRDAPVVVEPAERGDVAFEPVFLLRVRLDDVAW